MLWGALIGGAVGDPKKLLHYAILKISSTALSTTKLFNRAQPTVAF